MEGVLDVKAMGVFPTACALSIGDVLRALFFCFSLSLGCAGSVSLMSTTSIARPCQKPRTAQLQLSEIETLFLSCPTVTARMRSGEHQGYSRLVFDFPGRVPWSLDQ
ncbi:MAG: hypothetical protein AAFW87_14770, partial [Pseudomonadota bacterium]